MTERVALRYVHGLMWSTRLGAIVFWRIEGDLRLNALCECFAGAL